MSERSSYNFRDRKVARSNRPNGEEYSDQYEYRSRATKKNLMTTTQPSNTNANLLCRFLNSLNKKWKEHCQDDQRMEEQIIPEPQPVVETSLVKAESVSGAGRLFRETARQRSKLTIRQKDSFVQKLHLKHCQNKILPNFYQDLQKTKFPQQKTSTKRELTGDECCRKEPQAYLAQNERARTTEPAKIIQKHADIQNGGITPPYGPQNLWRCLKKKSSN